MLIRINEWIQRFWKDETGAVVSAELALIATLGVAGATVGIETLSKSVNEELTDVAFAIRSLDQSYYVPPKRSCGACVAGSCFQQQDVKVSHAELRKYQHEIEGRQKQDEPPTKKELKKQKRKNKEDQEDGSDE